MNPNNSTQPAPTPSFDFGSLGGLLDNTPATPPVVQTAPTSLSFGADDFVVAALQPNVVQISVVPEIQQTPTPTPPSQGGNIQSVSQIMQPITPAPQESINSLRNFPPLQGEVGEGKKDTELAASPIPLDKEGIVGDLSPVLQLPAPEIQIPIVPVMTIETPIGSPQPPLQGGETPQSRIAPTTFFFGCLIFFLVLVSAGTGVLYMLLQDPGQYEGVLPLQSMQLLFKIFGGLCIGIFGMVGITLLMVNIYKLITVKDRPKLGYGVGVIVSLILLGVAGIGGGTLYAKIQELTTVTANNSLIIPYIQTPSGQTSIASEKNLFAPALISYTLNPDLYSQYIQTTYQNKTIVSLGIDCGNNQKILADTNGVFATSCLYRSKQGYPLSLLITSADKGSTVTKDDIIPLDNLTFVGEVGITSNQGILTTNDKNNEIIVGVNPAKVTLDATSIYSDLNLSSYDMQRDLDGDGNFETKDKTNVTTTLQNPGLAYIYYTIPQIGKTIYSIPLRVTPSNVPVCTVNTSKTDGLSYNTTIGFVGTPPVVTDYTVTILDKNTNRSITTRKETRNEFTHTFAIPGNYAFGVTYITADGKQGSCESPSIQVAMSTYTIIPVFRKIKNDAWTVVDGSGMIAYKNDNLYINKLPTTLQLSVKNITPVVDKNKVLVSLDDKPLAPKKDTLYEFTITSRDTTKITIQINDPIEPYTLTIPITIAAQKSRGSLQVFPNTTGPSPLDITLDASAITLGDAGDEIITFSWDFGDGRTQKNATSAKISHTYIYDAKKDSGEYSPIVSITTKAGKKETFTTDKPIIVTKQAKKSSITIPSHPSQIASIGDSVSFHVQTDGLVSNIQRQLSPDNQPSCNDRTCETVESIYTKSGNYTISAIITYEDKTTSEADVTLVVK